MWSITEQSLSSTRAGMVMWPRIMISALQCLLALWVELECNLTEARTCFGFFNVTHSTNHSPGLIDSLIVHEDRLGQVLALSLPGRWKLFWEALPIQQMCIRVYHICVQVVVKVIYLWLLDSCWGCLQRRWRITLRLRKLRSLSLGGRFHGPLLGAPPDAVRGEGSHGCFLQVLLRLWPRARQQECFQEGEPLPQQKLETSHFHTPGRDLSSSV